MAKTRIPYNEYISSSQIRWRKIKQRKNKSPPQKTCFFIARLIFQILKICVKFPIHFPLAQKMDGKFDAKYQNVENEARDRLPFQKNKIITPYFTVMDCVSSNKFWMFRNIKLLSFFTFWILFYPVGFSICWQLILNSGAWYVFANTSNFVHAGKTTNWLKNNFTTGGESPIRNEAEPLLSGLRPELI